TIIAITGPNGPLSATFVVLFVGLITVVFDEVVLFGLWGEAAAKIIEKLEIRNIVIINMDMNFSFIIAI
ncbi:MAG: hypothetical protein ACXVHV_07750, partial [Methanobacterium sp.]